MNTYFVVMQRRNCGGEEEVPSRNDVRGRERSRGHGQPWWYRNQPDQPAFKPLKAQTESKWWAIFRNDCKMSCQYSKFRWKSMKCPVKKCRENVYFCSYSLHWNTTIFQPRKIRFGWHFLPSVTMGACTPTALPPPLCTMFTSSGIVKQHRKDLSDT